MMRQIRTLATTIACSIACTVSAARLVGAQTPAFDATVRLREVLPAPVAERVIARIADARSHELPAAALENRALKFAARGVAPESIEKSVAEQAERMGTAKEALEHARNSKASGDEIDAAAEAMRRGVHGADVSELARSAPSGRSLVVPLFVISSLMDRGLPSDSALRRVQARLQARATDSELDRMPAELPPQADKGQAHKPELTGQALAATKKPGSAGGANAGGSASAGPPAGVPGNGGKPVTPPGLGKKPVTPGKKKP